VKDRTTTSQLPLLDEATFEQLLSAAYVVQEYNERLRQRAAHHDAQTEPHAAGDPAVHGNGDSDRDGQRNYGKTLAGIVDTEQQIQSGQLALHAAMNLVVERLQELTGAGGVAIGVVEEDELAYRVASGSAAADEGTRCTLGSALSAYCLRTGKTLASTDTEDDARMHLEICRSRGVKSLLAAPFFHEGKVAGVLELRFSAPHAFPDSDLRTCELMASVLAEVMARNAERGWKQALATSEQDVLLEAWSAMKPPPPPAHHKLEPALADTGSALRRGTLGEKPDSGPSLSSEIAATGVDAASSSGGEVSADALDAPLPEHRELAAKVPATTDITTSQPSLACRLTHRQLKRAFQQMMPAFNPRVRIKRCLAGRKEPEPFPGNTRSRVLACQRLRQPHAGQIRRAVLLV